MKRYHRRIVKKNNDINLNKKKVREKKGSYDLVI